MTCPLLDWWHLQGRRFTFRGNGARTPPWGTWFNLSQPPSCPRSAALGSGGRSWGAGDPAWTRPRGTAGVHSTARAAGVGGGGHSGDTVCARQSPSPRARPSLWGCPGMQPLTHGGPCAAPGLGPGQRDGRQPLLPAVRGQDGVFPGSLHFSVRRWVGSHPLP